MDDLAWSEEMNITQQKKHMGNARHVSMYQIKYLLADQWTDQNFTEGAKVKENWTYNTTFSYVPFHRKKFSLSLSAVGVRIMINVPTWYDDDYRFTNYTRVAKPPELVSPCFLCWRPYWPINEPSSFMPSVHKCNSNTSTKIKTKQKVWKKKKIINKITVHRTASAVLRRFTN